MLVNRPGRALLAALALAVTPIVLPGPPAAVAAEEPECASTGPDDKDRMTVTGPNLASEALRIPAATALAAAAGRKPGEGVTVVLVDANTAGFKPAGYADLASGHGIVAGGIVFGGPQKSPRVDAGIAPYVGIESRAFYDAPEGQASDDERPPTPEGLAKELEKIRVGPRERKIVLIPAVVRGSAVLKAELDRLHAAGALIVAPVGDRPQEKTSFLQDYAGKPRPGEDAADDVWPAADDHVISVGISTPGAAGVALRSSGVDLAAPGVGSVSLGLQGGWCVVTDPSSSWAAAQVAGVAALVWSVRSTDTADQLRARLEGTATGNGDASPLTGHGVVQAVEALQRPAEALGDEGDHTTTVPRGQVPPERADLLADTREHAVWWGLAGGGALVVLLVLRPVLARRRR